MRVLFNIFVFIVVFYSSNILAVKCPTGGMSSYEKDIRMLEGETNFLSDELDKNSGIKHKYTLYSSLTASLVLADLTLGIIGTGNIAADIITDQITELTKIAYNRKAMSKEDALKAVYSISAIKKSASVSLGKFGILANAPDIIDSINTLREVISESKDDIQALSAAEETAKNVILKINSKINKIKIETTTINRRCN